MASTAGLEQAVGGVTISGPMRPGYEDILTPDALDFTAGLIRRHQGSIRATLDRRRERRAGMRRGELLDFLPETTVIRSSDWRVAPAPPDLVKRVVEITGPVDRKMIINALNSGADVFMADFEDSNSPTWSNCVDGQINLRDAVRRTIEFTNPNSGKGYALADQTAVLFVRPRGLHLVEKHLVVDERPAPAALFDFGLYMYHNAAAAIERGTGPYFYLPKLEHYLEARLWNDVFVDAQAVLGIPEGSVKATVLIETLSAAFQMHEILYELRDHSAGLNCGRWDYIFSFIKNTREDPSAVLPDRSQITMQQPCMRAYTQLTVQTCHRRGAHAMGGMAAQIPIKSDPEASEAALEKVRADKRREVEDGHDGTWVAHPGLVSVARETFEAGMSGPNQLDRMREDVQVSASDLRRIPGGTLSEEGLRLNVRVGIQYLEAWLRGNGCVPLYDLMEDAATAEISRTQVWQWIHHRARLEDGRAVKPALLDQVIAEELVRMREEVGGERFDGGRFEEATDVFRALCVADELTEFLTIPAYELLQN